MRCVVFIEPLFKRRRLVAQLGHDADPAAGFHQPQKTLELLARMWEMLHRFRTAQKVISLFQDGGVVGVVQVVIGADMPSLFKQHRERRRLPATEIQPARARRQLPFKRQEQPVQKGPVAGIRQTLLVTIVASFLFSRREVKFRRHKDEVALRAVEIVAFPVAVKRFGCAVGAERTSG